MAAFQATGCRKDFHQRLRELGILVGGAQICHDTASKARHSLRSRIGIRSAPCANAGRWWRLTHIAQLPTVMLNVFSFVRQFTKSQGSILPTCALDRDVRSNSVNRHRGPPIDSLTAREVRQRGENLSKKKTRFFPSRPQ